MLQRNLPYIIIIAILIGMNFLLSGFFRRFDLTKENRYSISEISKATADSLAYPMTIQVFIEGDYPPNIGRFQDAVRTTIQELQQYSDGFMDYEFIDPKNNTDLAKDLAKHGLPPIPVTVRTAANETENKQFFPYAIITYREKEAQYIDLVKGCVFPNGQIDFLRAEGDLEYKLVAPMRNLIREQGGNIAFIDGHGEIPTKTLGEWVTNMQNSYKIFSFDLHKNAGQGLAPSITPEKMKAAGKEMIDNLRSQNGIDVLVIPQPEKPFSEREKYEIDQYLMRGGNILWLMSQEKVDMDMYEKRACLSSLRDLNLDDMFLKYGFKINYNILQDLSCEKTEMFREGPSGGTFQSIPWIFSPMVYIFPPHPISRNVDQVLLRYASTIDTFHQDKVRKSVFLMSSKDSRTIDGQQFIDIDKYLSEKPPVSLFQNKGSKMTGVLIEGYFSSLFAGREVPTDSMSPKLPTAPFGDRSALPGKIIVISDGDFALGKNFRGKMGYMPYDNKAMLMNAIDYLAGDAALTQIRSKDVQLRLLEKDKIVKNKTLIQVLNLVLPIILVILFGFIRSYLRKRKNAQYEVKN